MPLFYDDYVCDTFEKQNGGVKFCILSTGQNLRQRRLEVALLPCDSSAVTNQGSDCQLVLSSTQIHRTSISKYVHVALKKTKTKAHFKQ